MDNFNQSSVLPDVFLRIFKVLAEEKEPISWKITKPWNGQISLFLTHSPTRTEKVKNLVSQEQDLNHAALVTSPERKKKSPARSRRDRERWTRWRQKRKTDTVPSKPLVTSQPATDQEVLESKATNNVTMNHLSQDKPLHLELPVEECSVRSDSEFDSDDDITGIADFCANCNFKPEGIVLKKCSKCQLSQYCSVKCQKENWKEHKFACSIQASAYQQEIANNREVSLTQSTFYMNCFNK